MKLPTEAEIDLAIRQNEVNARRMRHACESFGKAANQLREQIVQLRLAAKQFKRGEEDALLKSWELAEEHATRARASFARGFGWILNPDLPGVEAEELGMREAGSRSVMTAVGLHLAGSLDGDARQAQKARSAELANTTLEKVFGEVTRRVNPMEVLEGMAENGWDSKRIGRLCAGMLDAAEKESSLAKRQAAMRTVLELWKFTEPKAILETSEPIENMNEEQTREVMRVLARELGLDPKE